VHDAGSGYQLVGGIAPDVETCARASDLAGQRPNVDPREGPDDLGLLQVDLDSAELGNAPVTAWSRT